MHPEAHEGFGRMLAAAGIEQGASLRVLDVGGQDVNGTVHSWLPNAVFTTLDLENADIIADARSWRGTDKFDMVIATEVFEHVAAWRSVIATMAYHLDPDGPGVFIATCASTNRPPHGATGAPLPARDEWYSNVDPADLKDELDIWFRTSGVEYRYPPGDAYMWGLL